MLDMVKGGVTRNIAAFTVPLVLGNLFQLTYNAVDSIIVGRFAGDAALAAVGTADPVMNLLILFISGLCIGASVVMSNCFGAGQMEKLKKVAANLLLLGLALAAAIFGLGQCLTVPLFRLMRVPAEAMADAVGYMRVIFLGMPFAVIYNIYAASLRSIGDSRTPVVLLAASSVLNGLLDLLLVAGLGRGAAGAGWATVIAQVFSAAGCGIYTYRKVPLLCLGLSDLRPDRELIKTTLRYGSATALQQCSQPVGKLFIQGMVNTLGVSTMAAFNAVSKIEDFALVPERSIANAMMTFTAQNDGAGQKRRIRQGLARGMALECGYALFVCAFILLAHRPLLSMFSTGETTLSEGARYFRIMAFFYILPGLTNGIQGFFRGVKHMKITLALTLIQISVRVLVTYLLLDAMGIAGIAYACAAGWLAMMAVGVVYLKKAVWPGLKE